MNKGFLGLVVFVFLLIGNVYGRDAMGPMGSRMGDQRSGSSSVPPQHAIDACTGKSEGVSCQADEAGEGACSYTFDRKYLFCKPNKMSSEGRRDPDERDGSGDKGVKDNQDGTSTGTF
jgi:hypothetical protein